MIETSYKEKPFDNEIRNQLHQKWLEQQDADGTENLQRRLKCGKQRETTLLEGKEDEVDEEEFLDEAAKVARNVVRRNLKKAKEMISQMFTDKDLDPNYHTVIHLPSIVDHFYINTSKYVFFFYSMLIYLDV